MTDIALAWADGAGDLRIDGTDLGADDTLRSSILISLFSDARVGPGVAEDGDRRGWWGDTVGDAGPLGSHLWLLGREARRQDVPRRAEAYARTSLAWLVEDGLCDRIDVSAEADGAALLLRVTAYLPGGSRTDVATEI